MKKYEADVTIKYFSNKVSKEIKETYGIIAPDRTRARKQIYYYIIKNKNPDYLNIDKSREVKEFSSKIIMIKDD